MCNKRSYSARVRRQGIHLETPISLVHVKAKPACVRIVGRSERPTIISVNENGAERSRR